MMNLLKETIGVLAAHGRSSADVEWAGARNGKFWGNWKDFAAVADFEYDEGFSSNQIPLSLVVVGHDWWLERHEYDGSEWWEFKCLPKINGPATGLPSVRMTGYSEPDGWS